MNLNKENWFLYDEKWEQKTLFTARDVPFPRLNGLVCNNITSQEYSESISTEISVEYCKITHNHCRKAVKQKSFRCCGSVSYINHNATPLFCSVFS